MNLDLNKAPDDVQELLREWPLAFMFNLPNNATVVVIGAFKGRVIALLNSLYPTTRMIHGYEPQPGACIEAQDRFGYVKNIIVHNYGIKAPTSPSRMRLESYGTIHATAVREYTDGDLCEFCDAEKVFADPEFETIDLMVMNIEGYEVKLLEHLISTGILTASIKRLAVQFHPHIYQPPASLWSRITMSHRELVNDYPRWVYWVKRDA